MTTTPSFKLAKKLNENEQHGGAHHKP